MKYKVYKRKKERDILEYDPAISQDDKMNIQSTVV